MREIRFRAWEKEGNRMFKVRTFNPNGADGYVSEVGFPKFNHHLKTVELMQYTGLKDKNGKEIYEGDIIKGRNTDDFDYTNHKLGDMPPGKFSYSLVEWDQKMSGWNPFNYFSTNGVNDLEEEFYELSTCEVIGNIYENPELLK